MDNQPNCGSKKIALVTGSATGIGANIARDLAATGEHFVIVTGRNAISLQRVVAECNERAAQAVAGSQESGGACAFRADLCDQQQLDQLIEFVKCKFSRLDLLVNNACWRGDFADPLADGDNSFRDFQRVIHLNVSVPMYIVHKCLIPMRRRHHHEHLQKRQCLPPEVAAIGKSRGMQSIVINISSVASQAVVPLHSYSISKACLSEMSRQLAECGARGSGILSVTISPGPVLTEERPHHQAMSNLTLMQRVGTTQEVSNLVLFALNNAPLLNGKEINVDGGYLAKQKFVDAAQVNRASQGAN